MMRFHWPMAALLMMVFSAHVHAQSTVTWDTGYPKTAATLVKGIAVKGQVNPAMGWTVQAVTLEFWEDNKEVQMISLPTNNQNQWPIFGGNWAAIEYEATNAPSGTLFNVAATAKLTDGTSFRFIRTKTFSIKSK